MKWRDIPKFPHSKYAVDIDWAHLEDRIEQDQNPEPPDPGGQPFAALDLDPDFQREHVWTPAQRTAYIEYKLQGGVGGGDLYFNHVGWDHDWRGPYVCVDGKQRLETVRAFLRGDVLAFGRRASEFEGRMPRDYSFRWHIAALETRVEVLQWYLAINRGGTPHTDGEIERVRELLRVEQAREDERRAERRSRAGAKGAGR